MFAEDVALFHDHYFYARARDYEWPVVFTVIPCALYGIKLIDTNELLLNGFLES